MKIKDLIKYLETIAPSMYQESYDNSGLIVGNSNTTIEGVLICLDSTEAIIEEAIEKGCNMVIAHHPIVFKGLKRFNGNNYVERTIIKAIKHDIAIYAIHTNLDNVYTNGVNGKIAEKIGLENTQILAPKALLKKLYAFVPTTTSDAVRLALFEAGAGSVNNIEQLSYATVGFGSSDGQGFPQVKLEVLFTADKQAAILNALQKANPSSLINYDILAVENKNQLVGAGMIGTLEKAMSEKDFLIHLKTVMKVSCIKHTQPLGKKIKRVALCGGSGGFLLKKAISQKADIFITADYKYHEFFDADNRIIIADIGHYESEQFTIELLHDIITNKFSTFAAYCTETNTNPVHYLV